MKTVLFATRTVAELVPILDSSCMALVSIGCKPLIVHAVESLAMAGLTDVIVVVFSHAGGAVEEALGDGARWGMRLEYVLTTAGESQEGALERIRHRLGDECLLVHGEILRTPIITEFVERARLIEARSVVATIGGVEAGVRWIRGETNFQRDCLDAKGSPAPCGDKESRIEFPEACLSLLDSFVAFHRANLDILAGRFTGLIVPGREIV